MRHISLLFAGLVSSAIVTACSADPDVSAFHRAAVASDAKSAGGGSAASHGSSTDDSTPQSPASAPTPAPSAGATPSATPPAAPAAPATPPKTAVCANPTCGLQNGNWSCFANDSQGTPVEMDCGGGVCTCFTGNQGTTQFDDDNVASDGEARTLYSANCECL